MVYRKNEEEQLHEACGVFGIYAPGKDVARLTYYALYALQHRGQESSGITVSDGKEFKTHKNMGLASEVFNDEIIDQMKGHIALGHVLYADKDVCTIEHAQPTVFQYAKGSVALACNGILLNADELRVELEQKGAVFQNSIDNEIMMQLIASHPNDSLEDAICSMMQRLHGIYSLAIMTEDKLIGVRDPLGVRPLCLGEMDGHYLIASESCALDSIGAKLVRDVHPGEIIVIDQSGYKSIRPFPEKPAFCIFEYVYLARPDSSFDGRNVAMVRQEMGRQLAREHKVDGDVVIGVPDSGLSAAFGYAEESGIPYQLGILKNRYIARTFIQPTQSMRDESVYLKLNPIREALEGKKVIMVDDSIVRGTTSRRLVKMIRDAGASEVHLMISSPPVMHPCFYGINIADSSHLIAAQKSIEEITEYVGADGVYYLSLEGLLNSTKRDPGNYCAACFNGQYALSCKKMGQ